MDRESDTMNYVSQRLNIAIRKLKNLLENLTFF
jgi:hypothetical protein